MQRNYTIFLVVLLLSISSFAQCAMCRAQLESMDDKSLAQGVNDGIVYLMVVPYLLVGLVAAILYWTYKKKYS